MYCPHDERAALKTPALIAVANRAIADADHGLIYRLRRELAMRADGGDELAREWVIRACD